MSLVSFQYSPSYSFIDKLHFKANLCFYYSTCIIGPLYTIYINNTLTVKQILSDQFIQKWHSYIEQASRGEFYCMFKTEFCLENYLLRLRTDKRIYICKIRCSNLKFPIETGRWNNIPKHERFCNLCNLREIGN